MHGDVLKWVDKNCNNHYDGTVSKDIMFNIKGSKEAYCKL